MKDDRPQLRDLYYVAIPWAALCGMVGGWHWLWVRRIALPLTLGLLCWLYRLKSWRCLVYALATWGAFSLPYSPERHSWLVIVVVGATYGLTPWFLHGRWQRLWWGLASGGVLVGGLAYSAATGFPHKLVELAVFGLHGVWVAYTIHESQEPDEIYLLEDA